MLEKSTIPFLIISNDSLLLLKIYTLEFVINWFLSPHIVKIYCLENALLCLEYENSHVKSTAILQMYRLFSGMHILFNQDWS